MFSLSTIPLSVRIPATAATLPLPAIGHYDGKVGHAGTVPRRVARNGYDVLPVRGTHGGHQRMRFGKTGVRKLIQRSR